MSAHLPPEPADVGDPEPTATASGARALTLPPGDGPVRAARSTVLHELTQTLAGVDDDALAAALELLADRDRRWFATGAGRSGLVARMAAMRLIHLGHSAHVVGEATTPSIEAGDALLVLSSSGSTATTLHLSRTASDLGATLLVVTARENSPLTELADVVVVLPVSGSAQFGGSRFEQSALLLLDSLVLELAHDEQMHSSMAARHANLE